ncbi:MAG: tetratricopeptide repeat protein [Bacteroidetes bacterium]|nr:tetratricopeptide repeat protein [Bacteroidota bacterium]
MNRTFLILLCLFSIRVIAQIDSTGIRLINDRKFAEAELFFKTAMKNNTQDAEVKYYLAVALFQLQKFEDAEDIIDDAIDIDENIAKYHLLRGQILGLQAMNANVLSQGLLAPRIKNAFLKASELDPRNIEARQALYNYYVMAPGIMGGSDEKAFEQAHAVLKLNPFRGHMMLANFYNRVKKDTLEAEQQIKKAITFEPGRGLGYKQLGYMYLNRRKFRDACEQMQRYITAEPKNPDSYDSYGDVLKAEQKYDQAIEKYRYALFVDKTFSASIFSLAECYEFRGEKQKAKETFEWYLTVEPNGRRSDAAQKKIKEL